MLPVRLPDPKFVLLLAAVLLQSCAGWPGAPGPDPAQPYADHGAAAVQGVASCRTALARPGAAPARTLNPGHIGVLIWNIHKGWDPRSMADLSRLGADKDLVLIQEARLEQRPFDAFDDSLFWSFAPGYRTGTISTGVMTLSDAEPIANCHLSDREPWLRSPKAISITNYGLDSSTDTLAVVNVHAVNFTIGVADFQRQIGKVVEVLSGHTGPVILAGDFNTWRKRRSEVLTELARQLDLDELRFPVDNRITPFGHVIDRIFVRGLVAIDASTAVVQTSDHNPLSVTLSRYQ